MDQHADPTAQGQRQQSAAGEEFEPIRSPDVPTERGDAEQVQDFLRLEEHIAALQADRRPDDLTDVPADQLDVYRMAALFRAAAPGAADPDPAFAARLWARLERETGAAADSSAPPVTAPTPPAARGRGISRRGLLTGVAAAAAGVAAGVTLDRVAPQPQHRTTAQTAMPLVPSGVWVAVASADAVPIGGVVRFVTDHLIGFVRHTSAGFVALSGACTHMGCLLTWNTSLRTFDCPCHGGSFLEDGRPAPASPVAYSPLPAIQVKVEGGQVWVYVPATGTSPATPSGAPGYGRATPAGE
jgi:Rieske Fe-S protein